MTRDNGKEKCICNVFSFFYFLFITLWIYALYELCPVCLMLPSPSNITVIA